MPRRGDSIRLLFAALSLSVAPAQVTPTITYTYQDLGELSELSQATAINRKGWVIGIFRQGRDFYPFRFRPGEPPEPLSGLPGSVTAINGDGVIVGSLNRPSGGIGIIRPPGAPWEPFSNPMFPGISPKAINDAGQVAGTYLGVRAFVFTPPDTWTRIEFPIGFRESFANGLNNAGQVAGVANGGAHANDYRAFVWTPGEVVRDLGPGWGYAINDGGFSTGFLGLLSTPNRTAYLHSSATGSVTLLENRWSTVAIGYAINNKNWVVGVAQEGGHEIAVLWKPGKTPSDLNRRVVPFGGRMQQATGINDRGQIVGRAVFPKPGGGNTLRAFLLNPIPSSAAAEDLE